MPTFPLLICGPSGVGKSQLVKYLIGTEKFHKIVTVTTRPMREGEIEGKDYFFVNNMIYDAMRDAGMFFMDNNFFSARYATLTQAVLVGLEAGQFPIMETFLPTVAEFKGKFPNARAVFLFPQSWEQVEQRMRLRGDSEEKIKQRLREGQNEVNLLMGGHHKVDHIIKVGEKTTTEIAQEINQIVGINNELKHEVH